MSYTVLVHLINEDPILGEMDKLPSPQDTHIAIANPRKRDGKPVHYIQAEAVQVLFPWTRISFVEVFPGEGEAGVLEVFRE